MKFTKNIKTTKNPAAKPFCPISYTNTLSKKPVFPLNPGYSRLFPPLWAGGGGYKMAKNVHLTVPSNRLVKPSPSQSSQKLAIIGWTTIRHVFAILYPPSSIIASLYHLLSHNFT
jgi:hypothetical protein